MHKGIIIGAAFIGLSMAIAGGYQRQKAAELFSGVIADSQSNYVENVPDISENKESYEEKVSNISEETDIPEVLLEFAEKYPEASDFVAEYPQKKDLHPEIDLEQEVEKGTIPLFIQWDERWGYERYGSNFHGVAACGPTCLSMVVCGLTGETKWNPYEVAQFSEQKGYYISGVGTSWELMTNGAQELGLIAAREDIGEKIIREKLSEDTPMICSVGPGDFTDSGHFIVLRSIDEDGKIILNDSNSRINSEKHWDLKVLLPQIKAIWRFQVQ